VQILWGERREIAFIGTDVTERRSPPMSQQRKPNDLSRSLTALDMGTTTEHSIDCASGADSNMLARLLLTLITDCSRSIE
jgi:hypothetical protein